MAQSPEVQATEQQSAAVQAARSDFIESLERRLQFICNLLESLQIAPDAAERQASAQRRIHALKAAAEVLGFDTLAGALSDLSGQVGGQLSPEQIDGVVQQLNLLPTLVLNPEPLERLGDFRVEFKAAGVPQHMLVFGAPPLADAIKSELAFVSGEALECERTESLVRARAIALDQSPDVILVDYDRSGAEELVQSLADDLLLDRIPVIVVGQFDSPESTSHVAKLGVSRVLPKPVSPSTLRACVLDVFQRGGRPLLKTEGFGELSVQQLAERVAMELTRGLTETVDRSSVNRAVRLDDGAEIMAAVWGAIARIREVVTVRSEGKIRFDPRGPEGAIHIAPWVATERRAGSRTLGSRVADDVSLDGRLILIADDDPAVTWFISGLLRNVGAEVMEAHDGKQALALCQRHWPDALISDILMPEMDGFKLCREVKGDIAVRDVPVILLSWKEDMLQRVRELGAGADGYLKKEADGSLMVQRLREVLRPRSRIESRLARGGEIKGRLGDITPRLVLQLACQRLKNCQVSLRDAVFLYEISVRNGSPVSATRTSVDGETARGSSVLAGLLGVSAGRFVIRPSDEAVPHDFEQDLYGLLEEPIRSARGAREALGSGRLFEVEQVALDAAVIDAYMRATPESARQIARRVAQGIPVRQLVAEGSSAGLVEAVLLDLAQHGGVRAIVSANGDDLLPRAALAMSDVSATGEPPPVVQVLIPPQFNAALGSTKRSAAAAEELESAALVLPAGTAATSERPGLSPEQTDQVEQALTGLRELAPPELAAGSLAKAFAEAAKVVLPARSQGVVEASAEPRAEAREAEPLLGADEKTDEVAFEGLDVLGAERAEVTSGEEISPGKLTEPEQVAPEPAIAADQTEASAAVLPAVRKIEFQAFIGASKEPGAAKADQTPLGAKAIEPKEAPLPAADASSGAAESFGGDASADLAAPAEAERSAPELAAEEPHEEPPDSSGPPSASGAPEPNEPRGSASAAPVREPIRFQQQKSPGKFDKLEVPRGLASEPALGEESQIEPLAVKSLAFTPPASPLPAPASDSVAGSPQAPQVASGLPTKTLQFSPPVRSKPEPEETGSLLEQAKSVVASVPPPPKNQATPERSSSSPAPALAAATEAEPADKKPSPQGPVSAGISEAVVAAAIAAPGITIKEISSEPLSAETKGAEAPEVASPAERPVSVFKRTSLEDETPAPLESSEGAPAEGRRWLRNMGTVGAAAAAGLLAYLGVSSLMGGGPSSEEIHEESPMAAALAPAGSTPLTAVAAPAASPSAEEAPASQLKVEISAGPTDITLAADKGLLELNTGARHSIYVDGVFVGRGPKRRVPLTVGKHEVKLRMDSQEILQQVDVQAGKSTHVSL